MGFIQIHWYGLMYFIGFIAAYFFCRARRDRLGWSKKDLDDALFYCVIGVLAGGRLGYMLFYNTPAFISNPLSLFAIWQGGMSFHGAVLGEIAAFLLLARKKKTHPCDVSDFILVPIPIGLALGRLGNYINGELFGKPTGGDWGVIFPQHDLLPRHPTQLYEMMLEGVLLFVLLWLFTRNPRRAPRMTTSGLFLLGYGLSRFVIEFVRLPDDHLGYLLFGWVTMGQILTLPMIIGGIGMLYFGYRFMQFPPAVMREQTR